MSPAPLGAQQSVRWLKPDDPAAALLCQIPRITPVHKVPRNRFHMNPHRSEIVLARRRRDLFGW